MLDGLERTDWLLFMGADTIITNQEIAPTTFLSPASDLIVAVDENGLQSDVMFMRSCPAVKHWLYNVLDLRGKARCEQDAMSVVLGQTADYGDYRARFHAIEHLGLETAHLLALNHSPVQVVILPKKRMNSTAKDWTPGDFIFHAAGLAGEDRINAILKVL
jgi:hypothetical protein